MITKTMGWNVTLVASGMLAFSLYLMQESPKGAFKTSPQETLSSQNSLSRKKLQLAAAIRDRSTPSLRHLLQSEYGQDVESDALMIRAARVLLHSPKNTSTKNSALRTTPVNVLEAAEPPQIFALRKLREFYEHESGKRQSKHPELLVGIAQALGDSNQPEAEQLLGEIHSNAQASPSVKAAAKLSLARM